MPKIFGRSLLLPFFIAGLLNAEPLYARPDVWMMPPPMNNGAEFQELFDHPEAWQATRQHIDVLGYADHWMNKQFTDAQLRVWLPQLNKWGIKLGLEVGAIKPWGITGAKTFAQERKEWDRFQAAGGHIYAIAMDEPLSATLRNLHQPSSYAVEETANFIALVRANYPSIRIGDIEPYPGFQANELIGFIDALQARLKQMHVRGLDFFRLDVDWMHFHPGDPIGQEGWQGVKRLEAACRQRGLPFSLIYWAADYPSLQRKGLATEQTWENSIMHMGANYATIGGAPDEYVIESWLETPPHAVPETHAGTFSHSVLSFTQTYVPGTRASR